MELQKVQFYSDLADVTAQSYASLFKFLSIESQETQEIDISGDLDDLAHEKMLVDLHQACAALRLLKNRCDDVLVNNLIENLNSQDKANTK